MDDKELEEGDRVQLDFSKIAKVAQVCPEVIPVAVQNADTGEVILIAYTNAAAFRQAVATRTAVFWSTSRNRLWEKGQESGATFALVEVLVNCEQNSLVYRVRPTGKAAGICHTRNAAGVARNCYYRRLNPETWRWEKIAE